MALEDRRDLGAIWRLGPRRRPEFGAFDCFLVEVAPRGGPPLQVTHHQVVREMLLSRLDKRDLERLMGLSEKAMPGAVSSSTWPL